MRPEPGGAPDAAGVPMSGSGRREPADAGAHVAPPVYLTSGVAGVGGRIRERPEDFLVEEIPSYEPCGHGEHIYLFIEKREMSTLHLVRLLAAHFGVRQIAIGYAGLKDKYAITRQVVSIHVPGKKPEDFPSLHHASVRVLWADLHTNKLRRGHLRGNRFSVRIRGAGPGRVLDASRAMQILARDGVPNRIGEQRFGGRGNNHLVGLALARGDWAGVIDLLLAPEGAPERANAATTETTESVTEPTSPVMADARRFYAEGRYREALEACPRSARTERVVLGVLARGGTPRRAVEAIDDPERVFYVNAFQSAVFNAVLDERLEAGMVAALSEGDLAMKHVNGAMFAVEATIAADEATRERVRRLEISPTGPLWGPTMSRAAGGVDEREVAALRRAGLELSELPLLERCGGGSCAGARRALRLPVIDPDAEAGSDEHGPYIRCAFELPAGGFATSVLQEVMKSGASVASGESHVED